jgi:hypothetical protein
MEESIFPLDLEQASFKLSNGEYGWTREQALRAIAILVEHNKAILGGDLWWIPPGATTFDLVPQAAGNKASYHWETPEDPGEPWVEFVRRCAVDSLKHVKTWPGPGEIPPDLPGQILYNLTWRPD